MQHQKSELINMISSDMVNVFACFFRIMFIASIPWIVMQVDLKCLNPIVLFVIFLILLNKIIEELKERQILF